MTPYKMERPAEVQASDPRVVRAMEEYAGALKAGVRVNREEFLERHADVHAPLSRCMDGLLFIEAARRQFGLPVAKD